MERTKEVDLPVLYFGTPVALITTVNRDGSSNIGPISSAWALDDRYVLGLGSEGHTLANLRRDPDLVINLPSPDLVGAIEVIAPTTGCSPVPDSKSPVYRHESDKWSLGGFTPVASAHVRAPRIGECPVQIEAQVSQFLPIADGEAIAVEAKVLRVHVHESIVQPGASDRIDTDAWQPLYYSFRHYFAQGSRVGSNFRAEQRESPTVAV